MTAAVADLLFRPRNVVVYGASSDPAKLSGRPLAYLTKFGYAGGIYAINPHRTQVQGVPAYADLSQIDAPVDLAIIVVPAAAVVEAVERCANAGVGAAIIFASGFAEIGDPGTAIQDRITAIARRTGMRVVGPNCLGSFSAADRAFATFSTAFDDEGERPDSPIALVSQSGAVGTFTYSTMNSLGLGVRYFANTGNEADVTVVELLAGLVDAPDVSVLLGHIEGVQDFTALEELMHSAADRGKPLVLLKAGRTPAGSRAVAAHTASVAGDDDAFERAAATYGAVRVHSMEAMADAALAFVAGRPAAGRRLTVVTQSGGAGALAADTAVELGLVVEPWQSEDRELLASHLPYFASTANPIDATGSLINDVGILTRTLQVACDNDDTDAVLVVLGNSDAGADAMVDALRRAYAETSKPFFVAWTGGSGRPRRQLLESGIPTYSEPGRAVRVLSYLVEHSLRHATAPTAG
ncbi:CoA-binding protein [Rhodococcus sp. T2V]|uniref:acetate--CoA ligase family protein n=1 Tax=Rhodococcus sp. T2V TaxID=3034164 RepID=UPI0023E256FC|nr:CoA-binding protein [Rhodococcus sp. T2V]MDF3310768.1 CoA-binding protein [Rhodococcus sp. T2V]